jgi:mono/diheme cytochrome c family protein
MKRRCMSRAASVIVAAVAGVLGALAFAQAPSAGNARTTWDGVYTEAQASRGMQIVSTQCTMCHAENLQGGPAVPPVVGPAFMFKWNGKSLRELFELIRSTMPPGQAGSLGDQGYADVLAAILQNNHFPAGTAAELPADAEALASIQLRREKP